MSLGMAWFCEQVRASARVYPAVPLLLKRVRRSDPVLNRSPLTQLCLFYVNV